MQKRNICRTLSSQMTFDYFTTRLKATLMRSGIHGPDQEDDQFYYWSGRSMYPWMRFYVGPEEFRKILSNVDQVETEENVTEENVTEKMSQVTLKSDDTVTSQATDSTLQEKRVPKLNKKSFLFGEINSILESRKPTAEDKARLKLKCTFATHIRAFLERPCISLTRVKIFYL